MDLRASDGPSASLLEHPHVEVALFRPEEGKRVLRARREHVRRYEGTPFGELVIRNDVDTFRVKRFIRVEKLPQARRSASTPSESSTKPRETPKPVPGGSGGGGPSSGR